MKLSRGNACTVEDNLFAMLSRTTAFGFRKLPQQFSNRLSFEVYVEYQTISGLGRSPGGE